MSGSRKLFSNKLLFVQRQQRCDGRTYRAETVEQRVDGGWRNEDAVFSNLSDRCAQLRQIIRCLAMQALVHRHPKLVCDSICHIEPMQLRVKQVCQAVVYSHILVEHREIYECTPPVFNVPVGCDPSEFCKGV